MVPKASGFKPIGHDFRLMRTHIVTFSGSSAMGRDGEVKQRQHLLSSRRHNLPSKVRLCNNQTARNVSMSTQQ